MEEPTCCHLLAKRQLSREDLKFADFDLIAGDGDDFSLSVCKCSACGQLYLSCFSEIDYAGEEDYWSHFVPVSARKVQEVKEHPRKALELFKFRDYILMDPDREIFWTKGLSGGLIDPTSWAHHYLK